MESNSMNKFVIQLNEKKKDEQFLKAHDIMASNNSKFPSLSRLSLKRPTTQKLAPIFEKEYHSRGKRKQPAVASKQVAVIEYLPVPPPKKLLIGDIRSEDVLSSQSRVESRTKAGRELMVITGNVQFVLKTFKLYADSKALYEVYGYVMKIYKGKVRFEQIILMRSEAGPVLQAFYFDFTNILERIYGANPIRCVGQFTRQNRFHIHKIEELSTAPPDTVLARLQNVSAFALLQSQKDKRK